MTVEVEPTEASARRSRIALVALGVIAAAVWIGLARLALAFWRSSLDWEYVAEQSRVAAPWYYRLAGVWGGDFYPVRPFRFGV